MSGEQAVDRTRPPSPGPERPLRLPEAESFRLAGGLPVRVLESRRLPEVSVRLLVDAGAAAEAPQESGVAELTARLVSEGAEGRSALEMAEWVDRLGAGFSASVSHDGALLSVHCLSDVLDGALDYLRAVARDPDFAPGEVERIREERLDEIERDRDEPDVVADEALAAAVYGAHPYGRPSGGLYPGVAGLGREDVSEFHAGRYGVDGTALVVCGDVEAAALREALEARFGDWGSAGGGSEVPAPPEAPAAEADTVLLHRPGSAQSEIRVGGVGLARSSEDYFPVKVMNAVLGGLFNSRVNMNLREDKGWTYGAGTRFRCRRAAGPFRASAAVETGVTADAFRELEAEIRGMVEEPPTEQEMRLAKNALTLSLPRRFETASQITRKVVTQVLYGLPEDYWERYRERVEAVTVDQVVEAAERFLHPDRLVRVAVGDADAVADDLEGLGSLEVRPGTASG